MNVTKVLTGHTSEETAYLVSDYPYGRKIRCRIRYWLESSPTKGFRFVSQTEHPTRLVWNAPKKSTYYKVAACMYLDEKSYVQCAMLSEYSNAQQVLEFSKLFSAEMAKDARKELHTWILLKVAYTRKLVSGEAYFTMNGVRQEKSEAEIEGYKAELKVWEETLTLFTFKPSVSDDSVILAV